MGFFILFFAHLLADYPLQGDFLANNKGNNLILLSAHSGIWVGCVATAGFLIGYNVSVYDILLLFIIHCVADYLKSNSLLWYGKMDALKDGLAVDQLIHVAQIIIFMLTKK